MTMDSATGLPHHRQRPHCTVPPVLPIAPLGFKRRTLADLDQNHIREAVNIALPRVGQRTLEQIIRVIQNWEVLNPAVQPLFPIARSLMEASLDSHRY